mgnify:CR=1 FL=1
MTARSLQKGQRILESIQESLRTRVSYVVVKDIAQEGAFDEVRTARIVSTSTDELGCQSCQVRLRRSHSIAVQAALR